MNVDRPDPPPGGASEDPRAPAEARYGEAVARLVREFAYLAAEDGEVDLEAFVARQPPGLRDAVRRGCEDALRLLRLLRRRGAGG